MSGHRSHKRRRGESVAMVIELSEAKSVDSEEYQVLVSPRLAAALLMLVGGLLRVGLDERPAAVEGVVASFEVDGEGERNHRSVIVCT